MDHSTHSFATDSASDNAAPNQQKKRSRTSEETGIDSSGGGSFRSQDICNISQKEPRAGVDDGSTHTRQQRRLSSENDVSLLRDRKIKKLRLEAIFHPKFENESSEKDVRKDMLTKVGNGDGYLEVTLKHSGSLLLWSGGSRYYSKNDANNMVTLVGEFLLEQHMSLVWETDSKYEECSKYVQEHRLTLAFEVVTSVLGDHGDVPKQPYLILLSIADRSAQQFYTSHELIGFAQKFRLPHNDYWMFRTQSSCEKLFQFYDDSREIGTAETVIKCLDQLTNCLDADEIQTRRIPSMYPHLEYQGNILEGLVVRFVEKNTRNPTNSIDEFLQPLEELASVAESNIAIMEKSNRSNVIQSNRLMDLFPLGRQAANLEDELHSVLKKRQQLKRVAGTSRKGEYEASSMILASIESYKTLDKESQQIVQLMKTLKELGVKVEYKLYKEDAPYESSQQQRWVCIIHIIHDETFKRYRNTRQIDAMKLYRGFSFELIFDGVDSSYVESVAATISAKADSFSSNPLMLKLKFLPYMIRTFGCRNGLTVLSRSGIDGYEHYTLDLLKKWDISHSSIKQWQPYFYSWGLYAESKLNKQKECSIEKNAAVDMQLNGNTYLKHLAEFETLYHSGQLTSVENDKAKCHGLVIVVSANDKDSLLCGDYLSSELGIQTRFDQTGSITEIEMLASLCGNVGLCNTVVVDTQAPIKKLIKIEQYADASFVVLFGCSQQDIDRQYEVGTPEHRKASGMAKAWSRLRCKEIFHLPKLTSGELQSNSKARKVVDKLIELAGNDTKQNEHAGLLVFFPGIPGAGKSSLCQQNIQTYINKRIDNELGSDGPTLSIVTCEGDNVKGKYWPHVLLERLKQPASVLLADKNATPNVWDTIRNICIKSHAVCVPVLPDSKALCTSKIKHSGLEYCYPYSLSYLAVCMLRVLLRPKESHVGKLDESTDHAMLVVIMFYRMYEGISAENFLFAINGGSTKGFGGTNKLTATVPFFNESKYQELPKDLYDGLVDALDFVCSINAKDFKMATSNDAGKSMERRLRSQILKHQAFLESLCVSESESKEAFIKQLSDLTLTVSSDKPVDGDHSSRHKFVEIASVDIDEQLIRSALLDAAKLNVEVMSLLERIGKMLNGMDQEAFSIMDLTLASQGFFVQRPHVTMAHFSQLSQQNILKEYSQANGKSITLTITGILIGETVAAFSVRLPEFLDGMEPLKTPPCQNAFPHITIWVGTDESASKSNDLPSMVEKSEAIKVEFAQGIDVSGTLCFWYI